MCRCESPGGAGSDSSKWVGPYCPVTIRRDNSTRRAVA